MAIMSHPFVADIIADLEPDFSFPLLVDSEGEGPRVYGSPLPIYPRNVVIDRHGVIVHEDNAGNLDAAQAAIEAAFAE